MNYLIINIVSLALILFVIWWFWLTKKKQTVTTGQDVIEIKVAAGVYTPDVIQVKLGKPITLRFIRSDETSCAAVVIFADFNKSAELPVGQPYDLKITPDKKGEFDFTCQMGMYRGKLIVVA